MTEKSEASLLAQQLEVLEQQNAELVKRLSETEKALTTGTEALHRRYAERVKALEQECLQLKTQLQQKEQTEDWQMKHVS